jgi:16S rRNA (guanine966-N2)-methyltransferase
MRIVAGRHRGRRISAPAGTDVRPTSDRAREALFNIIEHGRSISRDASHTAPLIGARVLDAFAGSGALGLEALSRGAAHATFIERTAAACATIRANVAALGEEARSRVLQADAANPPPASSACGLVFLDPPYGSGLAGPALTALRARGWIAVGAICVVELAASHAFAPPHAFALLDERSYGRARLVFLRADPD